ncbi:MAG TPA: polyphenol oxidase family protein [Dongiaceae bacterium]|nr:polyphenol oxidase family protein [Dongiaceae bacterium]
MVDRAVAQAPAVEREEPVADAAVPRLELKSWAERYGVVAGITMRGHGFNLGQWTEDNSAQVVTRWRAFRAALERRFPAVVSSHQVHGTLAVWHERRVDGWLMLDDVDGHATATTGVLATVTVADCIPIYLAVPDKGAVALLHGGWRGIAGGILERGVDLLKRHAFARGGDIVMHCGVGICGECYEVGPEVATRFSGEPEVGPRPIDLRGILARQAKTLGITGVTCSPWCSAHDRASFFSHRASGGRDGRMVAYLGRPLG